jgi:hypothetical protein
MSTLLSSVVRDPRKAHRIAAVARVAVLLGFRRPLLHGPLVQLVGIAQARLWRREVRRAVAELESERARRRHRRLGETIALAALIAAVGESTRRRTSAART